MRQYLCANNGRQQRLCSSLYVRILIAIAECMGPVINIIAQKKKFNVEMMPRKQTQAVATAIIEEFCCLQVAA